MLGALVLVIDGRLATECDQDLHYIVDFLDFVDLTQSIVVEVKVHFVLQFVVLGVVLDRMFILVRDRLGRQQRVHQLLVGHVLDGWRENLEGVIAGIVWAEVLGHFLEQEGVLAILAALIRSQLVGF